MKVITNNVPREVIDGSSLSEEERKEFGYHDWNKIDEGTDSASFVRYKGDLYDLGDFERYESDDKWQGSMALSAFDGLLIRLVEVDHDTCAVIGRWFA